MTRRVKIWLTVASLFTVINAGGAVLAAANGEAAHTVVHVLLALVGAYFVRRIVGNPAPDVAPVDEQLEQLEQSVDAIALQVERIGEAQRFMVRLQQERAERRPPKPE